MVGLIQPNAEKRTPENRHNNLFEHYCWSAFMGFRELSRVFLGGLCILLVSGGVFFAAPPTALANEKNVAAKFYVVDAADQQQIADSMNLDLSSEDDADEDPLEGFNRAMFGFNEFFDALLLRPAAEFYAKVLPPPLQRGIRNFLRNLRSPIILANDLLQGEGERAGITVSRFFINTTIGIGGLSDQAGRMGYFYHNEDFGQTFAVWGSGSGPYLVLPILGPSNPRDLVGTVVEYLVDPVNIWADNQDHDWIPLTRTVSTGVAALEILDEAKKSSLDYYATIRSLYNQRRADEIRNGEDVDDRPAPGFSYNIFNTGPNQASGNQH